MTRISEEELAQIFEVRVMLETKLIQLAVPNMTEETYKRQMKFVMPLSTTWILEAGPH